MAARRVLGDFRSTAGLAVGGGGGISSVSGLFKECPLIAVSFGSLDGVFMTSLLLSCGSFAGLSSTAETAELDFVGDTSENSVVGSLVSDKAFSAV